MRRIVYRDGRTLALDIGRCLCKLCCFTVPAMHSNPANYSRLVPIVYSLPLNYRPPHTAFTPFASRVW